LPKNYSLKLQYTRSSQQSKQMQYRSLLLHPFPAVLQADGHQLILEEIPDWNTVELIVNGETVFRCNINELDFGGDGKLDPLCEEARKAVLNAY
uniref:Chromosome 10 open reading frame 53 n=1 Tax=Anas platyrhynchos platyrhynchos TaxID=8840 RepID=A0A493TT50_ANAPP